MKNALIVSALLCLSACADGTVPKDGDGERMQAESAVTITRFTQPGEGSVNSWLIEGNDGIVLVDAQRSMSAGKELVARINKTGKPVVAVLLTHPHPDHFGGLRAVLDSFPNTPAYASTATKKIMEGDENGFIALTKQALKSDAPDRQPIPNKIFKDGDVLKFGDIELTASEFGAGEADSATAFYAPKLNAAFVGDIVDNEMTGFVMEGQSTDWLRQIKAAKAKFSANDLKLYPGHGEKGGTSMFDAQTAWLSDLRGFVSARLNGGISDQEISAVVGAMNKKYPNRLSVAAVPALMSENVKAVGKELSAKP